VSCTLDLSGPLLELLNDLLADLWFLDGDMTLLLVVRFDLSLKDLLEKSAVYGSIPSLNSFLFNLASASKSNLLKMDINKLSFEMIPHFIRNLLRFEAST
jgi:hypothetical protein